MTREETEARLDAIAAEIRSLLDRVDDLHAEQSKLYRSLDAIDEIVENERLRKAHASGHSGDGSAKENAS